MEVQNLRNCLVRKSIINSGGNWESSLETKLESNCKLTNNPINDSASDLRNYQAKLIEK